MDQAAEQPVSSTIEGPWDDPPQPHGVLLAALRWTWDSAYVIEQLDDGGRLLISRADGHGSFTVADPLEARDEIIADFTRSPVRQQNAPGALQRRTAFERAHPEVKWAPPSTYHRAIWDGADGVRQEEVAVSVDAMLNRLRERGFQW